MASTTMNIGLTKPAGTDQALISAINGNMDIIDTKMGAVGNTSVQSQITSLSDQIASLNSKITTIKSSGSLHDLAGQDGLYWLTSAVTDKPEAGGGILIIRSYNTTYCVGEYIVIENGHMYSVTLSGSTWTYQAIPKIITDTLKVTTSATGAVSISAYRNYHLADAHYVDSHLGLIFRRDADYLTCWDNYGQVLTNTYVEISVCFLYY